MAKAWMKRSSERQALLETLKRAIIDEEEESHRRLPVQFVFCAVFLEYFKRVERLYPPFVLGSNPQERFLLEKILPAVRDFVRTEEEEYALMADLFEWMCGSITQHFKAPLQQQEHDEPEKIYEGHQAMDDVDL